MSKYDICTPFTGLQSPALYTPTFWGLLKSYLDNPPVGPMYNNVQARVIYKLQEMGMPANNDCRWLIGTNKTNTPFFELVTSYEGCDQLLAFAKGEGEESDKVLAALEYAGKIGYNVHGPWSFLMSPKPRRLVTGGVEALKNYPDAWHILSYPDCRSKKQWEECCEFLESEPRNGVAWTDVKTSGVESIVKLSRKGVEKARSWNE